VSRIRAVALFILPLTAMGCVTFNEAWVKEGKPLAER
jgi:hypothetical protein